nr:kinesin-like protein KIN-12E [Tanacetum cinerariifolium]
MFVIENPILPAPAADSEANVLAEWDAVYDAYNEVACLMLGSKTFELHRQFEKYSSYEMLQELKYMFEKQAGVERDFVRFVRNYNMHNIMKTIGVLHAMLIKYEKAKGKGKDNGKGKDKQVYILKPKNPKPSPKEHPAKDNTCHHCKEVDHWKRNCHVYLVELLKKKKQVDTASSSCIFTIKLFAFPNKSWVYDTDFAATRRALKSTDDESFDQFVSCLSGKMTRKSFPHRPKRATDLLGIIHTDVCGHLDMCQDEVLATSLHSRMIRYGYVYLLKHKHEVFETFKVFKNEVENQLEKTIKALRSDRSGEYIIQEFKDYLKVCGIVQQLTPSYTPQHNSVSKRRNRTLLDMVRSMINLTTLSLSFWDYALESATRILNMVPTKKVDKNSYELWYAEFFEKSLITQEVSGRAIDLEEIQDEDTPHSKIISEIPMEVKGFEPPQEKNEVSRLQRVISGGTENNGDDAWALSFSGSPGSFKWEGFQGSFSPVTAVKRMSQKKEYEVALVGAFRREKDKDITVQALTAETQAASQLAKQREDEIQGLKMRLRFRESAIKRLEGVASGKISAETHLLKEKEEHLKELEVLRSQVDRNQEVTRFAMENLRLKEEIRRLKSFYEEGEQERMNEQIMILENKLLEALDWKLMHESEPSQVKEPSFDSMMDSQRDGDFFNLKDPATPCQTEKTQFEFPLVTTPKATVSDQRELQTMVDAIAAASQREAEAHETAIILSKENDELRVKLKMLIDDNNKLIELYEGAVADSQQNISRAEESQRDHVDLTEFVQKELEMKRENDNLEHQLIEMHEENDKLLGLYEKAMQERDELKRLLSSGGLETRDGEANCDLSCEPHELVDGINPVEANVLDEHSHCSSPRTGEFLDPEESSSTAMEIEMVEKLTFCEERKRGDNIDDLRVKLDKVQEMLSKSTESITLFRLFEKEIIDIDRLSKNIQEVKDVVLVKQKEYKSADLLASGMRERENMLDRKLTALRCSISKFTSSLGYFQQREAQARATTNTASSCLMSKKKELTRLLTIKEETERAQLKIKQSEVELKNNIATLKLKIEEENKKREKDTVLLAIDNVEWQSSGKATELLKSEEEKTKLQLQMNHEHEKLKIIKKESDKLGRKLQD